jgi:hypothetical protein
LATTVQTKEIKMNFQNILKAIFPTPPTLDEYIKAHDPQDILDVEMLEKRYDQLTVKASEPGTIVNWN